jgi:hypothetical protein
LAYYSNLLGEPMVATQNHLDKVLMASLVPLVLVSRVLLASPALLV